MYLKPFRLTVSLIILTLLAASCRHVKNVFESKSPRQQYVQKIKDGPLAKNKMVRKWITTGDSVLQNPVEIEVPFQTKVVYFSDEANAWAWQFSLQKGRTLRARIAQVDTSHQVFADLFALENGQAELLQSAEDTLLEYTLNKPQTLVLRLQAELLVNGSATLTITDNPSMAFPVSGGRRADIGSFWGDPRDGGARRHKGVDIFAERGTPVIAAAGGRVTRTGNGGLGGKTVWLRADGKSLYYAHLDSINTSFGQGVETGDTLGFVGNTGNARTTPPHLHFGIYDRGAVNPLPFIDFANLQVEPLAADPAGFNRWGRINAARANVRPLPSTRNEPIATLSRNNPVMITGGTGDWYQVQLPDGTKGFIFHSLLAPPESPLKAGRIKGGNPLFESFTARQPFHQPNSTNKIQIYGEYKNRQLTKYRNHWVWVTK